MFSFLYKIAEIIHEEVDRELYGPASIKNQILKLEQSLKQGIITEEEYDEMENELLERLEKHMEDE